MKWFTDVVYHNLGRNVHGDMTPNPPGDRLRVELAPYLVSATSNDGFDLWVDHPDAWHDCLTPRQARKLAWFILWTWWAKGTWFGLRRRLWYWSLTKRLDRHRLPKQGSP